MFARAVMNASMSGGGGSVRPVRLVSRRVVVVVATHTLQRPRPRGCAYGVDQLDASEGPRRGVWGVIPVRGRIRAVNRALGHPGAFGGVFGLAFGLLSACYQAGRAQVGP